MTKDTISKLKNKIKEFYHALEEMEKHTRTFSYKGEITTYFDSGKHNAQAKRTSMDLTRLLADFRQNR